MRWIERLKLLLFDKHYAEKLSHGHVPSVAKILALKYAEIEYRRVKRELTKY